MTLPTYISATSSKYPYKACVPNPPAVDNFPSTRISNKPERGGGGGEKGGRTIHADASGTAYDVIITRRIIGKKPRPQLGP